MADTNLHDLANPLVQRFREVSVVIIVSKGWLVGG